MKCEYCEKEFEVNRKGSGGTNRALCFECLPEGHDKNERTSIRRALLVKKAQAQKIERGCHYCGYNKCAAALEWHHPEDDKLAHPSDALKRSWEKYVEETYKCILLCANCHREVHN